jgi:hypothetical protein
MKSFGNGAGVGVGVGVWATSVATTAVTVAAMSGVGATVGTGVGAGHSLGAGWFPSNASELVVAEAAGARREECSDPRQGGLALLRAQVHAKLSCLSLHNRGAADPRQSHAMPVAHHLSGDGTEDPRVALVDVVRVCDVREGVVTPPGYGSPGRAKRRGKGCAPAPSLPVSPKS